VEGISRAWRWLQHGETTESAYEIFNLGGSHPVPLLELIRLLETSLECTAVLDWQPDQPGDVPISYAVFCLSETILGYRPRVDIAHATHTFATLFRASDHI